MVAIASVKVLAKASARSSEAAIAQERGVLGKAASDNCGNHQASTSRALFAERRVWWIGTVRPLGSLTKDELTTADHDNHQLQPMGSLRTAADCHMCCEWRR